MRDNKLETLKAEVAMYREWLADAQRERDYWKERAFESLSKYNDLLIKNLETKAGVK